MEYLSAAALAFAPDQRADHPQAAAWARQQRRVLRDEPGGAKKVLARMKRRLKPAAAPLNPTSREALQSAVTYFANHLPTMDYAGWQARHQPIGSGVTEAACKTLIKQRMCQSGMRWSLAAADALISLRALHLTPSRWDHFWKQHCAHSPII